MKMNIPERIKGMEPFCTLNPGLPIRMDANESFISPPKELTNKIMTRFAEANLNNYPDPGCEKLCALFADRIGSRPECITAGNGSDELISMVIGRLMSEGGRLLTPAMDFGSYRSYANIHGKKLFDIPRDGEMRYSADDLIRVAKENDVELVIFSNPSSPSGGVMPRNEIEKLIKSLSCLVVVDEAYMDFSSHSVTDLVDSCENLMVLKTFSKAYGLAAIRLGFAIANPKLTHIFRAVRDPYNVNALTQIAGETILEDKQYLLDAAAEIIRTTKLLAKGMHTLAEKTGEIVKVYDTDANFLLVRFKDADRVCKAMAGIGIGLRKLNDGFVRISAASEENVNRFLCGLAAQFGV